MRHTRFIYSALNLMICCVFHFPTTGQTPSTIPSSQVNTDSLMVRIAELEIEPALLSEYNAILKEEAAASVRIEPGVIAIFPMAEHAIPHRIRIVEIYASRTAYLSHLQTPHFLHYKKATAHMVKSLKLVEMEVLDKPSMMKIFEKL